VKQRPSCLTDKVKRRRRVGLEESWKIVTSSLPNADWPEYVFGIPLMTVWWWITGVPDTYSPTVYRAAGMVSVQASCSLQEALALMRARAAEGGNTVDEIATGVIDRSVGFE
jgi:hypothetical protein